MVCSHQDSVHLIGPSTRLFFLQGAIYDVMVTFSVSVLAFAFITCSTGPLALAVVDLVANNGDALLKRGTVLCRQLKKT